MAHSLIARGWCVLLMAVMLLGGSASADVWRLAGTFNGWNASDPAWEMQSSAALPPGFFAIERRFPQGKHQFKFVLDGSWDRGHFGAGEAQGTLATPGTDIGVTVTTDAVYRVSMNPALRVWSFSVARTDHPVLVVHTLGEGVAGRAMVIDAGESITPDGLLSGPSASSVGWAASCEVRSGAADVELADAATPWRWTVTPSSPGPLTIGLVLRKGRDGVEQTLSWNVTAEPLPLEPGAPITVGPIAPDRGGPAWTIHLTGDFNRWAAPDKPGAVALRSRSDGTFYGTIPVSDGAHRYRLVVNGDREVPDPTNPRISRDDAGRLCSVMVVGREPADFPPVRGGAINTDAIRHNPSDLRDFTPISRALGLAEISACTLRGDVEHAFVYIDASESVIGEAAPYGMMRQLPGVRRICVPMERSSDLSGFDRWSARVMTGLDSGRVTYALGFKDGAEEFITRDYVTTISPAPEHPAWALGAVWYQIFPERFRNGNPLNDPHGPGVTQMAWNSDWYAVTDEEARAWKRRAGLAPDAPMPAHTGGPLYNVVWDRRYGGDLQGIVEKLDDLRDLGVTALYLNPVFEAESMHKYDATDYRHIDDNFAAPRAAGRVPERWSRIMSETEDPATWTWTPADRYFVDDFIPEVHKRGMKLVLDGVFNHTGRPFWAFDDIERLGERSSYAGWYYVKFNTEGRLESWTSWFNTGALPKFRQTDTGDLVAPVKQHLFNITRRWMDPNADGDPSDGIDGWRLDVALDVGLPFWRDWRALVKSINPNAVIIAEIWDDASGVLDGDTFDTQMNYPFAKPVLDWLGVRPGTTSTQLSARLTCAFNETAQTNLIHQNLFGSHDTDRYVSMLFNPGREYDQRNRVQDADGAGYRQGRPPDSLYRLSVLGVAIQATYPGAPMVYYGDEVGLFGADDPTDRKPFPWPDTGAPVNPDDRADPALRDRYAHWLNLRHDPAIGPVLRYGSVRHLATGRDDVFAFIRELNGVRVVVAVNRGEQPFDATPLLLQGTENTTVAPVEAELWVLP